MFQRFWLPPANILLISSIVIFHFHQDTQGLIREAEPLEHHDWEQALLEDMNGLGEADTRRNHRVVLEL